MKRFEIVRGNEVIGETDLEFHDFGMNVHSGRFYPLSAYDGVRSVFKLFSLALDLRGPEHDLAVAEYYRKRDALGLRLRARDCGYRDTIAIHINDFDDAMDDLQVEVIGNQVFDDFPGS